MAERQGAGPIPIDAIAAGLQMWLQLAIFEAAHGFRAAMQLLEICLEDWTDARMDLNELNIEGPSNLEDERGLTGNDLRSEIESTEQARRVQWEELVDAIMAGRMPRVKFAGLGVLTQRLETRAGDHRERQLIELAAPTLYVLDEPERHLHPLWHLPMADWLQHRIASNGHAQALVATHAVTFSELGAASTLIYIRRPRGSRSAVSALERTELTALSEIALDLGWDRGQLISTIAVWLFVEGRADQAVLQALAGDELRTCGVAVIPLHGESRAPGILDAEIVIRYSSAAVAVWLDRIPAKDVADMLADPRSAIRIAKDKSKTPEIRTVGKLVAAAAEHGSEVTPIPHPGGDIFDLLDEETIRQLFPAFPTHEEARRAAEAVGMSQKQYYFNTYGISFDVAGLRRIASDMVSNHAPRHGAFTTLIETCCALARDRRLLG